MLTSLTLAILLTTPSAPLDDEAPTRPVAPGVIALAQSAVTLASCLGGGLVGLGFGLAVASPGSYGAGTALGAVVGAGVGSLVGCAISPLFVMLVGSAMGGRGTTAGAVLGLLGGALTSALLVGLGTATYEASPFMGVMLRALAPVAALVGPAIGYAISAPPPTLALAPLPSGGATVSLTGRW